MADNLSETEIVKNIFGNGDENAGIIEDAFDYDLSGRAV